MATILPLNEVCEKALRLPCSPTLMPKLIKVLEDVNSSSDDIEQLIRMDTALAGSTLRLANSAFFAGGDRIESLSEAIIRLGSQEIYRLAALSLAGRWMNQPVQGYRWEPGDFCRRNLVCAIAAEHLARKGSHDIDPSVAYTAALIHEIGKLAIAFSCGEQMPIVRELCETKSMPWEQAELEVLGYNYAMVGAELLRRWNFPKSLVSVAEIQPPTSQMDAEVLPLAVVVHAGKFLSVTLGPGAAEDGFLFNFNSELMMEHGFTPEVLEGALPDILAKATKVLGEKLLKGEMSF